MFYSIPCMQNMIVARQTDFIRKMTRGPPDQPLRNMITACCDHKRRAGRPQTTRTISWSRTYGCCFKMLTGIPLLAHKCATFINELRTRLITFLLFVPWQHLTARNDRKLFSSNCGVSHLNEACNIDDLSRGFVLGLKFSQTTSDWNVL